MFLLRLPVRSALLCVFVLSFLIDDASAQPEYSIGPTPSWVKNVPLDRTSRPSDDAGGGVYMRLLDYQTQYMNGEPEYFTHTAVQVLNQQGIPDASRFSVSFDPDYQSLTLHDAVIHRGSDRRNALMRENISVLHREEGLEWQIYDGRKTVNVILEDLRIGDVVEYSYSVRGANPIFDGMVGRSFYTQYAFPIGRMHYRIVWPSRRRLHVKQHDDAPDPVVVSGNDVTEYTWDRSNVAALVSEGDTPSWYDPYPWVELSEWTSWREIVEWALPMYGPDPEPVSSIAAEISAGDRRKEGQLLAALRFAQDEVRYLGFEMGRGSHQPRRPSEVLQTRFGDCKDKSRLLISILAALDIEAHPALVHSSEGKTIGKWHPTPDVFDHVIVVAYLDGKRYWIDPTMSSQGGSLERLYQPDYGHALVIRDGETVLTDMNPPRLEGPNREVEATLDLSEGDSSAHFSVRTIYYGPAADNMRATLEWQSKSELSKNFLNYYAAVYPTIETKDSISIHDDLELNRLIIDEGYTIKSIWETSDDDGLKSALLFPTEIRDLISRPSTSIRTMPLEIQHPSHVVYTMSVILPEPWNVTEEQLEIDDDAVDFSIDVSYANEVITLKYEYLTKTDHLMPDQVAEHLENVDQILESISYELYDHGEAHGGAAAGINWILVIIALLSMTICTQLAARAYKFEPRKLPLLEAEREPRYSGLRGWLLVLAVGIVVAPFRILSTVNEVVLGIDPSTWNVLTNPSSEVYHALWAPALIFEAAANSGLLVFSVLIGILFFTRRHSFPRICTLYLAAAALVVTIDTCLTALIPTVEVDAQGIGAAVGSVVGSAVWIAYIQMSKRVESTFVERRDKVAAEAVPAAG